MSDAKGPVPSRPPIDYFLVRDELHDVLDEVRDRIGEHSTDFIRSLLDHGEFEVAIETLCDQLYEYSIAISLEIQGRVNRAADEMRFDSSRLKLLDELVSKST